MSNFIFRFIVPNKKIKAGNIVGVEEVASILYALGNALPSSETVNVISHPYYNYDYNYNFKKINIFKYCYLFLTPLLLGYLITRKKTFIYISGSGFLIKHIDGREFEFKALKKQGCNIICFFTGSDIRSLALMKNFSKEHNIDVITTYMYSDSNKNQYNDNIVKKLAQVSDKYANAIFNPSVDQISYIKQKTFSTLYFADDGKICFLPEKFQNNLKKIIVHAPSSPIIKGTPLVRAAIKKLQEEGYVFEYIELIGVPNTRVISMLKKAHIALNQFYAFVPGVFGIEAMMNNTVLLTSADRNIEPSLFEGANEAWVVTPYWRVYDNLKEQLEKPMEELKIQADKGTAWVTKYASSSFSSAYMQNILNSLDND